MGEDALTRAPALDRRSAISDQMASVDAPAVVGSVPVVWTAPGVVAPALAAVATTPPVTRAAVAL